MEKAAVHGIDTPVCTNRNAARRQEFCLLDIRWVLGIVPICLHICAGGGEHLDGRHRNVPRSPVGNIDVASAVNGEVCSTGDTVLSIAGRGQNAHGRGS